RAAQKDPPATRGVDGASVQACEQRVFDDAHVVHRHAEDRLERREHLLRYGCASAHACVKSLQASRGSLSHAEAREDASEQILGSELAGDLAQALLRIMQLLCNELCLAALRELTCPLDVGAGARECIEVPLPCRDCPGIDAAIAHAAFQM